jgi:ribosomal protein L22
MTKSLFKKSALLLTAAGLIIPNVGYSQNSNSTRYEFAIDRFLDEQFTQSPDEVDYILHGSKTLLGLGIISASIRASSSEKRKLEELKKLAVELENVKLPDVSHKLDLAQREMDIAEAKAKVVVSHASNPELAKAQLSARYVGEIEEIDARLTKLSSTAYQSDALATSLRSQESTALFQDVPDKAKTDIAKILDQAKANAEREIRDLEKQKGKLSRELVELKDTPGNGLPKSLVGEDGSGARETIRDADKKATDVARLKVEKETIEGQITSSKKQLTGSTAKSGRAFGKTVRVLGYFSGGFLVAEGSASIAIMQNLNKDTGPSLTYHFLNQHHSDITESMRRALEE